MASKISPVNTNLTVLLPKYSSVQQTGILCSICEQVYYQKKEYEQHYIQHKGTKEVSYTCVKCQRQYTDYSKFRNHCYLAHVAKDRYSCEHCQKSFCKLAILNAHIAAVHKIKCKHCDEIFSSKTDLNKHNILRHSCLKQDTPPYNCRFCDVTLTSFDECDSHIDKHVIVFYPCPVCKEAQPDKLSATKHLAEHFDEDLPSDISVEEADCNDSSVSILGGILCYVCDTLFRTRVDINNHFAEDHPDKPVLYSCNVCSKSFEKYQLFGDHCYYHYSKEKFSCDQCDRSFQRLSLLVIHTETFHICSTTDKPFCCHECGHGFMTNNRLIEHQRIVHANQERLHRCTRLDCSAVFSKPKDLVQHLKVHNKMLDNWCKTCGLQFISLASAQKHLDVHRIITFPCLVCSRTYNERYFLNRHLPSHFETSYHVCKICGKIYNARNRLLEHTKTHSQKRNFQCSVCEKSFLKKFALDQHMNTHTGDEPHQCFLCPKQFTNYSNCYKHLRQVHKVHEAVVKKMLKNKDQTVKQSDKKSGSAIAADKPSSFHEVPAFGSDANNGVNNKNNNNVDINETDIDDEALSETVNACIKRICSMEDFDSTETFDNSKQKMGSCIEPDFYKGDKTEFVAKSDSSHITAIVEEIEELSGELQATPGHIGQNDMLESNAGLPLQYTEMMPMEADLFPSPIQDAEFADSSSSLHELTCGGVSEVLHNLDDHCLPHINPLLTIKDTNMYVPTNNYNTTVPNINDSNTIAPIMNNANIYDPLNSNSYTMIYGQSADYIVTTPINYEIQNLLAPPVVAKFCQ